jgi:hypothetical protein
VADAFGCLFTTVVPVGTVAPGPSDISNGLGEGSKCGVEDGQFDIGTTGGTSPLVYTIDGPLVAPITTTSNFRNGMPAGLYTVTVADANGCKYAEEVTLESYVGGEYILQRPFFTTPTVVVSGLNADITNASCGLINGIIDQLEATNGGTVVSNMAFRIKRVSTGSTTFINDPEDGLHFLNPGFYIITAKNTQSCEFGRKVFVENLISLPTPTVIRLNINGILWSTAAEGNQWFLNGNAISGATERSFTPSQNGNYSVRVTLGNCAVVTSNTVSVGSGGRSAMHQQTEDLDKEEPGINSFSFEIFPNPNDGNFEISFNSATQQTFQLKIFNALGQVILDEPLPEFTGSYSKQVKLSNHAKGVYTVVLNSTHNRVIKKIITY